nr:10155_t:CDS:2 [Entrophospora candida]
MDETSLKAIEDSKHDKALLICRKRGRVFTRGESYLKMKPGYGKFGFYDSDGDTAQCEYDKSIDIWSFGIVNYYMLSQKHPWNVNNHVKIRGIPNDYVELYDNIMKGDLDFSTFKSIRIDIDEIETVMILFLNCVRHPKQIHSIIALKIQRTLHRYRNDLHNSIDQKKRDEAVIN